MEGQYIHIDVLLRQIQPEVLLRGLTSPYRRDREVDSRQIMEACYRRNARSLPYALNRSEDELIQRYRDLKDWLDSHPRAGIFSLLAEYGDKNLRFWYGEPLCRQESILEWRERTLHLGQDTIVCAALAAKDAREGCVTQHFVWPPAIRTDHFRMWEMLEKGIAENHFHLNGSTQHFSLAWGYLMNHPSRAKSFFKDKKFQDNLQGSVSYGERDNKISWRERIYYAAWIRARLFCLIQNPNAGDARVPPMLHGFLRFHQEMNKTGQLSSILNLLRSQGARLPVGDTSRMGTCLDYAITWRVEENNRGPNRFLAGERAFLYGCFRACFSGAFSDEDQDLLYLYLLIKRCLREELVQTNGRLGFRNFSDYQDRKDHEWGWSDPYWRESYRLSIAGALYSGRLESLELRVMPSSRANTLRRTIREIDRSAYFALRSSKGQSRIQRQDPLAFLARREQRAGLPSGPREKPQGKKETGEFFYVLHFPKKPDKPVQPLGTTIGSCGPRNMRVRQQVKQSARALATALSLNSDLCGRIRGIDACSHEIGCRPEIFAVAFRYLRTFTPSPVLLAGLPRCWPKLGVTYHVGEDFLDITDGLRAIDEAVCFLNMEQGDRLGHALALGVEPEHYYQSKALCVFLPAQDLLDNLIWVLYRSEEWGIPIPSDLRVSLQREAERLFKMIYRPERRRTSRPDLDDYYRSWTFRGDDPSFYEPIYDASQSIRDRIQQCLNHADAYERAKLDDRLWEFNAEEHFVGMGNWLRTEQDPHMDALDPRCDSRVVGLLGDYHFDAMARQEGQKIQRFKIQREYIALMRAFQDCMQEKIMERGIGIECNPSSNVLIGTFGNYQNHPIFRFNDFGLPLPGRSAEAPQLQVCVNTDDQGVFDTLLENEYCLLFGGLASLRDADGGQLLDQDCIFQYLDHLRAMGRQMVFPKSEPRALGRYAINRRRL